MKYSCLILLFFSTLTFGQNSLLYEISGNGLAEKSYLMGTVHVQDEKVFNWNDSVYWAMNQAKVAAFELDMNESLNLNLGKEEKEALTDFIFKDFFPKLMATVPADSLGTKAARDLIPFYKSVMGQQLNLENRTHFVDQFLQNYCRKQGVEIVGIESTQEQLNAIIGSDFDGLSDNLLEFFKKDNWQGELQKSLDDQQILINAYARHDYDAVCEIMDRTVGVSNNFLLNLYDRLLTNRNQIMYDRTKDMVAKGGAFIAVGCGHLCTANGLVAQYRQAGYTVRPMDIKPSLNTFELSWKKYEGTGYTVDVPLQVDSIEETPHSFYALIMNNGVGANTIYTSKGVATFKVEEIAEAHEENISEEMVFDWIYEEGVESVADEDVLPEDLSFDEYEEVEPPTEVFEIYDDEEVAVEQIENEDSIEEIFMDSGDEGEEIEYQSNRSMIPGLNNPEITEEMRTYAEAVVGSFMAESMKNGINVMSILNSAQSPEVKDTLTLTINGQEQQVERKLALGDNQLSCSIRKDDGSFYEISLSGDPSVIKSEEFLRFFTSFKVTP